MSYYERNLPHWQPEEAAIFLTWRLHGTPGHFQTVQNGRNSGRDFAAYDRELAAAVTGPKWLEEPAIAQCVVDALRFGERHLKLYTLVAYCVMPNHVHTKVEPDAPIARITKSLKGFTARTANQILGRTGEPFWQGESYDHWIRNEDERNRIILYLEANPVAAGLVETIGKWPWSSAAGS